MKRHTRIIVISVLMLSSLACATLVGTPEPTAPPPPTSTPVPTEAPPPTATTEPEPTSMPEPTSEPTDAPDPGPGVDGSTVNVINESGRDIWYLYISPSDAEDWGEDLLGDEVILDGESFVVTDLPEGVYDMRAEDETETAIEILWEVDLSGENDWTVIGLASLEIVNESEDTIVELYISPSTSDTWGEDWLGGTPIASGETYVLTDINSGVYDIKATDAEGDLIESVYQVALQGDQIWTIYGRTDIPDNAVLRFEDDFTDNQNNWGLIEEDEDVKYMPPTDGEYCIQIKSDNLTAWEWYEPFRTDEFVAEVSCRLDPVADASCGLGFGEDGDNLYWFEISPSDQSFALFVLQNDEWQDPLIAWTTSKNILPDGVNYLSTQRVDGVVSVFINGVLAGEVQSDLFPDSRIGLGGSTYEEGNITACLDNLSVWRLE